MKLTYLNPPELPDWSTLFSQVVVAEASPLRVVVTSGQVGVDAHQSLAGDGSFEAQVEQAFANLAVAISAAGCSLGAVAKLTIYVVGYEQERVRAIRKAVGQHFGTQSLPACTLVGVQALARPEFLVEVEALAIATSVRAPKTGVKRTRSSPSVRRPPQTRHPSGKP
jgi:enamine deaminase RidA (YjgF/YER057c/UK114 family)